MVQSIAGRQFGGNLILSRGRGESVMIGDDIEITVVRLDSHRVRLAFDAPGRAVHRKEIWLKVQEGMVAATEAIKEEKHAK